MHSEWGDAYLKGLQKNHWNSYEMLVFRLRGGTLSFAVFNGQSFIFTSYWLIFWQILEWSQCWVSLAVSSPLPLLGSFVDQESFQGTGELRYFMEYLAHCFSALWVYPIKAEEYFLQGKHIEWWITLVHADMWWCPQKHAGMEPRCHMCPKPSTASS